MNVPKPWRIGPFTGCEHMLSVETSHSVNIMHLVILVCEVSLESTSYKSGDFIK